MHSSTTQNIQACMLRFWKGKATKACFPWWRAPYRDEEIVNFYWIISRAPRQWPGASRLSPSLPPWSIRPGFIHDCAFDCICDPTSQKEEDKSLRETFGLSFFVLATQNKLLSKLFLILALNLILGQEIRQCEKICLFW